MSRDVFLPKQEVFGMAVYYVLVNKLPLLNPDNEETMQFDTLDEARQEAEQWNFWEIVRVVATS